MLPASLSAPLPEGAWLWRYSSPLKVGGVHV